MIDTHCHLNFKAFSKKVDIVLSGAQKTGVRTFVVPGTEVASSKQAVELAKKYRNIFTAVGIHPHHVYECNNIEAELSKIESLITQSSVVAVGEVGVDMHTYIKTRYSKYVVTDEFRQKQEAVFRAQIRLAIKYKTSLIIHNRSAVDMLINILSDEWDSHLANHSVFHCCEADNRLLRFANDKGVYIGIDGDITWSKKKQRFVAQIPISKLVLETDSPFLTPEPARKISKYPNEPKNLFLIRDKVACVKNMSLEDVEKHTTDNALKLFPKIKEFKQQ